MQRRESINAQEESRMFDNGDFSGRRSSSVLRQLSRREPSSAQHCARKKLLEEKCLTEDDQDNFWEWQSYDMEMEEDCFVKKKKVMVFVDGSRESRTAALWAASNLLNPADTLILIYVFECRFSGSRCKPDVKRLYSRGFEVLGTMRSLCRACRPEVPVETYLLGSEHRGNTIVSQAKKVNAAMLILGQRKPSFLQRLLRRCDDELIEYCIRNAHCLALGVRKQSGGMGGYIINSRWHRDFWLLA